MKYYHLRIGWQQDCYGLKEMPDFVEREHGTEIRGTLVDGKPLLVMIPYADRWAIVQHEDIAEIDTM